MKAQVDIFQWRPRQLRKRFFRRWLARPPSAGPWPAKFNQGGYMGDMGVGRLRSHYSRIWRWGREFHFKGKPFSISQWPALSQTMLALEKPVGLDDNEEVDAEGDIRDSHPAYKRRNVSKEKKSSTNFCRGWREFQRRCRWGWQSSKGECGQHSPLGSEPLSEMMVMMTMMIKSLKHTF